jgi:hypothetical protein
MGPGGMMQVVGTWAAAKKKGELASFHAQPEERGKLACISGHFKIYCARLLKLFTPWQINSAAEHCMHSFLLFRFPLNF